MRVYILMRGEFVEEVFDNREKAEAHMNNFNESDKGWMIIEEREVM